MDTPYDNELAALLHPQDDVERGVINYLTVTMARQYRTLIGMIARAVNSARTEGYDLGWHERGEHEQQR